MTARHRGRARRLHAVPARGGAGAVHARGVLAMGAQEWQRAVAFEALEQARNASLPPMPLFAERRGADRAPRPQERRDPRVPRAEAAAHRAGVDPALPQRAHPGRTWRRSASWASPTTSPATRASTRTATATSARRRRPALLLPVDRPGPAADHRARGRARPLLPDGAGVGAREPDPPPAITTPAPTRASASTPRR